MINCLILLLRVAFIFDILCKAFDLSSINLIFFLKILPGKVEFYYLPINAQSLLILPIPQGGAVVISTNQAKILKLKDLNRIRSVVAILKNIYI